MPVIFVTAGQLKALRPATAKAGVLPGNCKSLLVPVGVVVVVEIRIAFVLVPESKTFPVAGGVIVVVAVPFRIAFTAAREWAWAIIASSCILPMAFDLVVFVTLVLATESSGLYLEVEYSGSMPLPLSRPLKKRPLKSGAVDVSPQYVCKFLSHVSVVVKFFPSQSFHPSGIVSEYRATIVQRGMPGYNVASSWLDAFKGLVITSDTPKLGS
jgi:hypothetical protein